MAPKRRSYYEATTHLKADLVMRQHATYHVPRTTYHVPRATRHAPRRPCPSSSYLDTVSRTRLRATYTLMIDRRHGAPLPYSHWTMAIG